MGDLSTSQNFTTGMTVTAPIMNNIMIGGSINSSFISSKSVKSTLASNDSLILTDNGGNFWRITGSTLADGLVNAEPNFARTAVGPLSTYCPIINGNSQIAQRTTSVASLGAAGSTYVLDKWKATATGAMTGRATVSQQAAGPITGTSNYPDTEYCNRITITTAQASLAAGDSFVVEQYVEQQFARALYDNTHSISILLRSSVTGTYCVALRNNNAGTPNRSYVLECVITSANAWQRFTFPAIAAMPTGSGTWGTSDADYSYRLSVSAGTGTTFQTAAGSWATGNFNGDANQTNLFATNGATLDFTLVQHETGNICTPFIWTPFDLDHLRCRRYYRKSFDYASVPGVGGLEQIEMYTLNTSNAIGHVTYDVPMRAAPAFGTTLILYGNGASASGKVFNNGSSADVAVSGVTQSYTTGFFGVNSGAVFTATNIIFFAYTADVDF